MLRDIAGDNLSDYMQLATQKALDYFFPHMQ